MTFQIGRNIRNRRVELGISQQKLARATQMSQSGVSLIESGERGVNEDAILRICNALMVTPNELFGIRDAELPDDTNLLIERIRANTGHTQALISYLEHISREERKKE